MTKKSPGISLEEIKFRIGSSGEYKDRSGKSRMYASALVYIDVRTVNRELRNKFGESGHEFEWKVVEGHKFAVHGVLSIRTEGQWIVYEDVGYPQSWKMTQGVDETECLKDAVSDAKKRCAVHVGIGEFLYEAPDLFTNNSDHLKIRNGRIKDFSQKGKNYMQEKIDKWYKHELCNEPDGTESF